MPPPAAASRAGPGPQAIRAVSSYPTHPSLQFKPVGPRGVYSVRIGLSYRALDHNTDDLVVWTWIGLHSIYDRIIDSL
jgi:hypothetical protein